MCDLFWYVEYCSSVFTRVLSRLQCVQIYSDSATNFVLIQVCVCGCTCVCDTGGSFVVQQVCVNVYFFSYKLIDLIVCVRHLQDLYGTAI